MAGFDAQTEAPLARRSNSAYMAGGERYVQSFGLKSFDLSRWQVLTPRLPGCSRCGCEKPKPASEIMPRETHPSRRQLLAGIATASNAASILMDASTLHADATMALPDENPVLLQMGDRLMETIQRYHRARAKVDAIVAEWSPRWPAAPEAIHAGTAANCLETDLLGVPVQIDGSKRRRFIWTANEADWSIRDCKDALGRQPGKRGRVRGSTQEHWRAELERWTAVHDAAVTYEAECARVRLESGIDAAVKEWTFAERALNGAVDGIMRETEITMLGTLVKVQALDAWGQTSAAKAAGESHQMPMWGPSLASGMLRIATPYAVGE